MNPSPPPLLPHTETALDAQYALQERALAAHPPCLLHLPAKLPRAQTSAVAPAGPAGTPLLSGCHASPEPARGQHGRGLVRRCAASRTSCCADQARARQVAVKLGRFVRGLGRAQRPKFASRRASSRAELDQQTQQALAAALEALQAVDSCRPGELRPSRAHLWVMRCHNVRAHSLSACAGSLWLGLVCATSWTDCGHQTSGLALCRLAAARQRRAGADVAGALASAGWDDALPAFPVLQAAACPAAQAVQVLQMLQQLTERAAAWGQSAHFARLHLALAERYYPKVRPLSACSRQRPTAGCHRH